MKTYEIAVTRTVVDLYRIQAESEDMALEDWGIAEPYEREFYTEVNNVESNGEVKP